MLDKHDCIEYAFNHLLYIIIIIKKKSSSIYYLVYSVCPSFRNSPTILGSVPIYCSSCERYRPFHGTIISVNSTGQHSQQQEVSEPANRKSSEASGRERSQQGRGDVFGIVSKICLHALHDGNENIIRFKDAVVFDQLSAVTSVLLITTLGLLTVFIISLSLLVPDRLTQSVQ